MAIKFQNQKIYYIPVTWEEEEEIVDRETDWILKEKKTDKKNKDFRIFRKKG